jgi:hypothetical protein
MFTEQQIKDLAYDIWEKEGRPEGKDTQHYFQARQTLEEKHVSSLRELASPQIAKSQQHPQTHQLTPPVAEVPPGQYHTRRHNFR